MDTPKPMKEKLCNLEARVKALVEKNKYQRQRNKLLLDTLQRVTVLTEHIDELKAEIEARTTTMLDGDQGHGEKSKEHIGKLWEEMKIKIVSLGREYDSISAECVKRRNDKLMPEKQKAISESTVHSGEDEAEKSHAGCTINKGEQKDAATELLKDGREFRERIGILSTVFI